MHVDVRVTESDFQVFNLGLFHFGRGEWSNFPLGILSPLPDDFTVVSTLRRPPVLKKYTRQFSTLIFTSIVELRT